MSQTLKGTCVLSTMQSAICTDSDFFGGMGRSLGFIIVKNILFLVVEVPFIPILNIFLSHCFTFLGAWGSSIITPSLYSMSVILFLFVPWYYQFIYELVSDVVLILHNFPLSFLILFIYLGSDFISMLSNLLYS